MGKKRRIEITVETERLLRVGIPQRKVAARCTESEARVSSVTLEEAAALMSGGPDSIYRRVENGYIHYIETPDASLFIFLNAPRRP